MKIDKSTGEVTYSKAERLDMIRLDKIHSERAVENSNLKFIFSFLYIIFALLLIVALYRACLGQDPLTFTYILNSLENVPTIHVPVLTDFTITGDWGVFDFFKNFLNFFTTSFGVLVFISTTLINVFMFVGWLILLLFGVI